MSVAEQRFALRDGTAISLLKDAWVAYSSATQSSHVLNEECAAIIRVLAENGAAPNHEVCTRLAAEFNEDPAVISTLVGPLWHRLIDLGLVTEQPCPPPP